MNRISIVIRKACFIERLKQAQCREYLETMFLYNSASVLCGARPATFITLRSDYLAAWQEQRNALMKATGLETMEVRKRNGFMSLLIYSEAAMRAHLREPEESALLAQCGYPRECGPEKALQILGERFLSDDFPHEIGVFLGYPPKDVRAFIENEGKNCVCCRYWKVYHDLEDALETFRRIDEAQSYAMEVLREPIPLHVAANLLKTA